MEQMELDYVQKFFDLCADLRELQRENERMIEQLDWLIYESE